MKHKEICGHVAMDVNGKHYQLKMRVQLMQFVEHWVLNHYVLICWLMVPFLKGRLEYVTAVLINRMWVEDQPHDGNQAMMATTTFTSFLPITTSSSCCFKMWSVKKGYKWNGFMVAKTTCKIFQGTAVSLVQGEKFLWPFKESQRCLGRQ